MNEETQPPPRRPAFSSVAPDPCSHGAPLPGASSPAARPGLAPPAWTKTPVARYAAALLIVALTWALRAALQPVLGDLQPFTAFYLSVALTAWAVGSGPAVLAALLGWLVADWFFVPPRYRLLHGGYVDLVAASLFLGTSAVLILITHFLQRARRQLETTLQSLCATEERFRLFMDNIPNPAWVKDDQGRYVYLNQAYQRRFGVTLAECQGKTDRQLWDPATAARLCQNDQAALAAGRPIEITEETTERDGSISFWHNTKFSFRDHSGRRFLASSGTDLTPRKHAEDALRAAKEQAEQREQILRAMMEHIPMGLIIADAPDVTIRAISRYGLELTGHSPGQVQGLSLSSQAERWQLLHADGLTPASPAESPLARAIRQGEIVHGEEWMIIRADGTRIPILCTAAPIRDSQDRIVGGVVGWQDISERKRVEQALRQQEKLLRIVLDLLPVGIWIFDAQGQLVQNNPAASLLWDNLRHEPGPAGSEGRHFQAGARPPIAPGDWALTLALQRGQPILRQDIAMVGTDGHPRIFQVSTLPIINQDETVSGAVLVGEDITQRKEYAAQLERTVNERTAQLRETIAELEGFSYILVHDMRAPLRAMHSYGSILEREAGSRLPPFHRELLRQIQTAAQRMDQLITDALNYSRILHQKLPLGPVDLGALLRGLVETYPNLHPRHAAVAIEIGHLLVHSNPAALTQVFSNLLGNAVKFVAPGVFPRVRVWAQTLAPSEPVSEAVTHEPASPPSLAPSVTDLAMGSRVRVFVEDNGVGIPKEARDKIFGMFQRLHRDDEYPGTGIGLALVKKSLERTGGHISVESEPGHGSRFCVELPLAPAAARPAPLKQAA